MKIVLCSLLLLFSVNLNAGEWFGYDPLGSCKGEADEGVVVFSFYSRELDAEVDSVKGFVLLKYEYEGSSEDIGAYDATFRVNPDYAAVTVDVADTELFIPFGEDVEVKDPDGMTLICNLEDY